LASQINASNSGFGGIVSTGDSSGVLQLQTVGTTAVTIDTSQNTTLTGKLTTASSGIQFSDGSTQTTAAVTPYVLKNRIINGAFAVDQRNAGASQTITGGASPLAFNCDRWQVRSQGANATVQQVVTNNTYRMVFTGLASNSGVAASQSIEAINCADMAGRTVTLSLLAKSTSLTSLTLEAYYANTTNTFGTWASPTVTSIGTQSVTISTTEALVSYTFAVPSAATTGLQIRITSGALAATQTLTIGNVQLEVGSSATSFEWLPFGTQLALCQRYYEKSFDYGTVPANGPNTTTLATPYGIFSGYSTNASPGGGNVFYKVTKRAIPTVTPYGNSQGYWYASSWGVNAFAALSGDSSMYFSQQQVGGYAQTYGHWASSAEL
jgi:hypothetical protein